MGREGPNGPSNELSRVIKMATMPIYGKNFKSFLLR